MNASKENAVKAADQLQKVDNWFSAANDTKEQADALAFLRDFVAACQKRLPSEAAIAKDKQRKSAYNEARKKSGLGAGATNKLRETATPAG